MNAVTHDMLTDGRTLRRPSMVASNGVVASIARTVGIWRARIRDRQAFATFDHRDLRDLRLSQWEVEREMAKPFWRD
jgi:uncharacterized protein YjiS (DUF1127 family)